MKTFAALLTLMTLTQGAFAFQSGDRYRCYDNVSRETSTLTIVDIGDEEAYVSFKGQESRFYPTHQVYFVLHSEGATFGMMDKEGRDVEVIQLPDAVAEKGRGKGHYQDGGDSRDIDCKKVR